uniref:Uncharacterized protein n=1 Tax=Glossina palpalis gambiensis TaxID=67801 RepID=A0A1B0BML0_9MUSC
MQFKSSRYRKILRTCLDGDMKFFVLTHYLRGHEQGAKCIVQALYINGAQVTKLHSTMPENLLTSFTTTTTTTTTTAFNLTHVVVM